MYVLQQKHEIITIKLTFWPHPSLKAAFNWYSLTSCSALSLAEVELSYWPEFSEAIEELLCPLLPFILFGGSEELRPLPAAWAHEPWGLEVPKTVLKII